MYTNSRGSLLLMTIVFSAIAITMVYAFIGWASTSLQSARRLIAREQAFQIAEAGIDYYRWHLAHADTDYQDGTGDVGPYTHIFYDKTGVAIGEFELEITPPIVGSTLVTIESTGSVYVYPSTRRTIQTKLAIPSFAKYAIVSNGNLRVNEDTETYGLIHSNQGVRFDGFANNLVTSSRSSYDDPTHADPNQEFGVHTHVNEPPSPGISQGHQPKESPPPPAEDRIDVFAAGREFPVQQVDFAAITNDLSTIKTNAQADGQYFGPSGALGYHMVLKTDDTFDLYQVTSLMAPPGNCKAPNGQKNGWGTWTINPTNGETLLGNYTNPDNGLVFVEDTLWIDGQIDTARLTIAAATFPDNPSTRRNIVFLHDLLYTHYDGQDVIGLIAQNDFMSGMASDYDLRIDAALVTQHGNVWRYAYGNQCSPYNVRGTLTTYGMLGTSSSTTISYVGNQGYQYTEIIYDPFLLFGPPPSFPLTSDKYSTISWEEIE